MHRTHGQFTSANAHPALIITRQHLRATARNSYDDDSSFLFRVPSQVSAILLKLYILASSLSNSMKKLPCLTRLASIGLGREEQ